ncbi:DUF5666 domain-containing protein [Mycolicibacterium sp. CBMA 226]|uniref:DUF5666 domain-containing protein n=1 Tax=Mycolicibacterium sp. CBMA 226 TaxID=2606611 RepID=UPI0012DEEEC5|nr:DUF5666 domain-containing protein [Mycolicibacterium sp. CBMA 226]MUL77516.1 hypothetical protein [Mycolicibacterium sp. CBMA 226]
MSITSRTRRCGVVTLAGFAALSLAACGSSSTPSAGSTAAASSSPSSAGPAPGAPGGPGGKDRVSGLVNSVSGGTVSVAGKDGPATVDITSSTRITQLGPGQLTDVTAGECVAVRPVKGNDNGSAMTAANVLVGRPGNAQCGQKGGKREHGINGTVASVNGSTIMVTDADNAQITVTVTPDTRYTKSASADAKAIAAGMCLGARGTKDGNGALQATFAMVRPAVNGACGGGGGEQQHR